MQRAKKIATTKPTIIEVGAWTYTLEPAQARTHYGEHRGTSMGQPYMFRSKKTDEDWMVSDAGGRVVGHLSSNGPTDWTFDPVKQLVTTPAWLRAQWKGMPSTIYELKGRVYSGSSALEALAYGLGIKLSSEGGKTPAELQRDIDNLIALGDPSRRHSP